MPLPCLHTRSIFTHNCLSVPAQDASRDHLWLWNPVQLHSSHLNRTSTWGNRYVLYIWLCLLLKANRNVDHSFRPECCFCSLHLPMSQAPAKLCKGPYLSFRCNNQKAASNFFIFCIVQISPVITCSICSSQNNKQIKRKNIPAYLHNDEASHQQIWILFQANMNRTRNC